MALFLYIGGNENSNSENSNSEAKYSFHFLLKSELKNW